MSHFAKIDKDNIVTQVMVSERCTLGMKIHKHGMKIFRWRT